MNILENGLTPSAIYSDEELETLQFKLKSLLDDFVKETLSTVPGTDSILIQTAQQWVKITDIAIDSDSYAEGESDDVRELTVTLLFPTVTVHDIASAAQTRE